MRVGVLGTFLWDSIGEEGSSVRREGWGGLMFVVAALRVLAPDVEVVVVSKVAPSVHRDLDDLLRRIGCRSRLFVDRLMRDEPTRAHLTTDMHGGRVSSHENIPSPWGERDLRPLLGGVDNLLVSHNTGSELELADAVQLRHWLGRGAVLYADLHRLQPDGVAARTWLGCYDVVQANEAERHRFREAWAQLWNTFGRGPGVMVATLGAMGSLAVNRFDGGVAYQEAVCNVAGHAVGCGDVFAASMFSTLVVGRGLRSALADANRAAALAADADGWEDVMARLEREA